MSQFAAKVASTLCPILANTDSNIRVMSYILTRLITLVETTSRKKYEVFAWNYLSFEPDGSTISFVHANNPIF